MTAERIGAALVSTLTEVTRHIDGAYTRREGDALVGVTGIPVPTMNGVQIWSSRADAEHADALLTEAAAAGVPFSLAVPAETAADYDAVVTRHALGPGHDVPLLVLDPIDALVAAPVPSGLHIRQLADDELPQHWELAGAVFDLAPQILDRMTPRGAATRAYVGNVDGRPVTTGLGITIDAATAVFNIVTAPAHRGVGYAAAITERVVRDGAAAGATFAWLQSSDAALSVYRRLGFDVAMTMRIWTST